MPLAHSVVPLGYDTAVLYTNTNQEAYCFHLQLERLKLSVTMMKQLAGLSAMLAHF